jgi:hypothetical protein
VLPHRHTKYHFTLKIWGKEMVWCFQICSWLLQRIQKIGHKLWPWWWKMLSNIAKAKCEANKQCLCTSNRKCQVYTRTLRWPATDVIAITLIRKSKGKGKGRVALVSFFDLGTRWRWVVSFRLRPLCPQGKSPWYPLDMRLGGPQSRSGRGSEEKNPQPPPGIEP